MPINRGRTGYDAEAFRFLYFTDVVGGRYQNFGGNTAAVEAGTPELTLFYNGYMKALTNCGIHNDVGSACAYNN